MKQNLLTLMVITLILTGCSNAGLSPSLTQLQRTASISPMPTKVTTPTFSPKQATNIALEPTFIAYEKTQEYLRNTAYPATLEARNVHCKDGFVIERSIDILSNSNDQWTLFTCSPTPPKTNNNGTPEIVDYGTRYTEIIKTDLSVTWIIPHYSFDYSIINGPDSMMHPILWTRDGRYLYMYPGYVFAGGDGAPRSGFLYSYINSIYRINLVTGVFSSVLLRDQFGDFEFSPDEQSLVYSEQQNPAMIHVRNLETGYDRQVNLGEGIYAAGAFLWNSDGTKIVIFAGYEKKDHDWWDDLSATSIYILNPRDMNVRNILAKNPRIFTPFPCPNDFESIWLNENSICLDSLSELYRDSLINLYSLNIDTGRLVFMHSLR
jgi:hypothetical protein